MFTKKKNHRIALVILITLLILSLVLSACGGGSTPVPTQDPSVIQTEAAQTVIAELTQNAPIETPVPEASATPEPPETATDANVPVVVVPTPSEGEASAVALYNTYILSGPGNNYVVYGSFLGSQKAIATGKSEDGLWWAISVPVAPNGIGWVSGEWVAVTGGETLPVLPTPPVPPTTDLVPVGPSDPQVTALVNTAVRNGPGNNYPAYGYTLAGSTGRVIGKSQDGLWWTVRLNPEQVGIGYGWVSSAYVQAQNVESVPTVAAPVASNPVPPPAPEAGAPVATATDYVNIRSGPGTNYPVLGVAAPGASAEIAGKSADDQWWEVKIPTTVIASGLGWVSASYVTTQDAGSVAVVESPPAPAPVPTSVPKDNACSLQAQNPADNTILNPDTSFSTTWTLLNKGTTAWDQAEYDVVYQGAKGAQLHQGPDVYDLTTTVQPGWTYTVVIPMISPSTTGTYAEGWAIAKGNQIVCQFWVIIGVK